MKAADALALLEGAVSRGPACWADLGCGAGVFTHALAELLGPNGRVYAVDHDRGAIAAVRRRMRDSSNVIPVIADFTSPFELPGLDDDRLDGMLLANSLHYVRDTEPVLSRLTAMLAPGGRVVLIEYDGPAANPWVPYPVGIARWTALAASAGLSTPAITARKRSRFGGTLYVATSDRPGA